MRDIGLQQLMKWQMAGFMVLLVTPSVVFGQDRPPTAGEYSCYVANIVGVGAVLPLATGAAVAASRALGARSKSY
jgi:hypothetical protein